jgi:hypothetical protein
VSFASRFAAFFARFTGFAFFVVATRFTRRSLFAQFL